MSPMPLESTPLVPFVSVSFEFTDDQSSRITDANFQSLCLGGPWITDAEQRIELVGALRLWQDITAWPVDTIIHTLSTAWQTE